jgi:predicted GIY-YIG superfamily endonuclease
MRVMEHRSAKTGSHTARYRITRLVYIESYKYVDEAIAREKQLKDWRRERKVALIEADNPAWEDLAAEWDAVQERMRRLAHGLEVPLLEPARPALSFGKADPSVSLRDDSLQNGEGTGQGANLSRSHHIAQSILKG